MHKQRAKQEENPRDQGGKNLVSTEKDSGEMKDSSEWSKASPDTEKQEPGEGSFEEKVEEARQQIKDNTAGSQQQEPRQEKPQGDQELRTGPDAGEDQSPVSTREAMEEVKKIAKGEKSSSEQEAETPDEEVEESDGEERPPGMEDERYEELVERLEDIEERLDERESSGPATSGGDEDLEARTAELESHMPSWDELGSLEDREDDSLIVKADLDTLNLEEAGGETDEKVLDRVEELEDRLDRLDEIDEKIEKVEELQEKTGRIDELDEKVDDLEGELRGEEIEIRNRLGDLEDEIEGLRNKMNASDETGDIHGQAMHEEMQELREDVKELSNAVVQISKKVYDQK